MHVAFSFLTIGAIALMGAMSPGPDFVLVTKNCMLHSRKDGIYTGIGVGLGILVHVVYSLVGIGFIISRSLIMFSVLKYLGAAYLTYLGIQLVRTKKVHEREIVAQTVEDQGARSMMRSLREGFINSAINPKTTVFFLGLFTQVIDPTTHVVVQALYGMEIATIVGLWFVALSFALSVDTIKRQFGKVHHVVAKMMGGLLVLLGVRVAFASNS